MITTVGALRAPAAASCNMLPWRRRRTSLFSMKWLKHGARSICMGTTRWNPLSKSEGSLREETSCYGAHSDGSQDIKLGAALFTCSLSQVNVHNAIGAGTLFSIHLKPEKSPTIHRNLENRCGMRMNSIQGRLEIDCQGKCENRDDFRSARHTQYD